MKKYIPVLVLLSVTLTACPGASTPNALTSISGTVVEVDPASIPKPSPETTPFIMRVKAWTGGAGKLKGTLRNTNNTTEVDLGALNADGSFKLTLPTPAGAGSHFSLSDTAGCTGKITVSDTSAAFSELIVDVVANRSAAITPFTASGKVAAEYGITSLNLSVGSLLYVDKNVNVSGTQTCAQTHTGSFINNVNLNLVQGWNMVSATIVANDTSTTSTFSSGALPTNQWVFGGPIGLGAASVAGQSELPTMVNEWRSFSFLH